jgi:hypothetical protein
VVNAVGSSLVVDRPVRSLTPHCLVKMYNVTCLLTPWNLVLLKNLNGLHLVKKFPAFYGTRRFITAFTRTRHLSLS